MKKIYNDNGPYNNDASASKTRHIRKMLTVSNQKFLKLDVATNKIFNLPSDHGTILIETMADWNQSNDLIYGLCDVGVRLTFAMYEMLERSSANPS